MASFQIPAATASSGDPSETPPRSPRHIILDGRTLEGGGQLVRNALALSALTSRPVTIDHVRGNRGGGPGLKASHSAAVKLLAEISRSKVTGGQVGSRRVTFEPQVPASTESESSNVSRKSPLVSLVGLSVQPEYTIRLPTPGSVFLVFQALYPYLLHVGSQAGTDCVKVTITGGTNGTSCPSYDYASQVMAPNFAKLGLPPLSIELIKRGWTVGPIEMGTVTFNIHPLSSVVNDQGVPDTRFPGINLMDHEPGKITQIDITVLAPDSNLSGESRTLRKYIERETRRCLRRWLPTMHASKFDIQADPDDPNQENTLPINIHTSEPTTHTSRVYILLVAHTSTGFRIGTDVLTSVGGESGTSKKNKNTNKGSKRQDKRDNQSNQHDRDIIASCIDGLVEVFTEEISMSNQGRNQSSPPDADGKPSVLDVHMRDQIVVFEALGETHGSSSNRGDSKSQQQEGPQFWSLHTRTSQWVCQKMLVETAE